MHSTECDWRKGRGERVRETTIQNAERVAWNLRERKKTHTITHAFVHTKDHSALEKCIK